MKTPTPTDETWYLLFGGQEIDGRGPGEYKGRTTDVNVAAKFCLEIRRNPYSTGHVETITDSIILYEAITDMKYDRCFSWLHCPATLELRAAIHRLEES